LPSAGSSALANDLYRHPREAPEPESDSQKHVEWWLWRNYGILPPQPEAHSFCSRKRLKPVNETSRRNNTECSNGISPYSVSSIKIPSLRSNSISSTKLHLFDQTPSLQSNSISSIKLHLFDQKFISSIKPVALLRILLKFLILHRCVLFDGELAPPPDHRPVPVKHIRHGC